MIKKLGKSSKDLKETNMTMSNFTRESTPILGFLIVELTVGSKTTNNVFFVVDTKLGYTILLGRKCIHANQCVYSTLYQQLQFWNGDQVEVVDADPFLFMANVRMQGATLYSPKIKPIPWLKDVTPDSIKSFNLSLDGFEVTIKGNT